MVQKFTDWFILEPIIYKEGLHLREISRRAGVSHPTLARHFSKLIKEGIVKKEKRGNQTHYQINKEHPLIIDILSMIEKEKIYVSAKNKLLLQEVMFYLHQLNAEIVVIFGSAVDDIYKAEDVDVLIVGDHKKEIIKEIQDKLRIKMHIISVKELNNVSNTLKKEIIKKHLIIEGVERCIKWMLEK